MDVEAVVSSAFASDFRALTLTPSLMKLLRQHNVPVESVRDTLRAHYLQLLNLFHYFACTSGVFNVATIKANTWAKLLTAAKLTAKTKADFGVGAKVIQADGLQKCSED